MMTFAIRTCAALAASAATLLAWLNLPITNPTVSAVTFREVVSELRRGETLQLRLEKDGQPIDIWIRAPDLVRREESPQRYQIAAGSRLWKIDEAENTAVESDSPWLLSAEQQVDLLGLLDVAVKDAAPLLRSRPMRRESCEGRTCLVYDVQLPVPSADRDGRSVRIEAFADAASKQLVALRAWPAPPAGTRGKVPLAELKLLAINVTVDDDKFTVAKSLTEDGRIGKVAQAQGIVVLRPMLAQRWTPIAPDTLLKPGDWLRTELRGANALRAKLSSP